ncbi:MAG: alpha-beta hydrolase superfamily lysophospholipase [Verrucomicrobiales bacterium]|jgi:alpha-beta hydrolase superfamily lysophospholipase
MKKITRIAAALAMISSASAQFEIVSFDSQDGLEVTADLFMAHENPETPFILLFHQAGFSRGEYREIAPRLNQLGFNCMAIDQRSGNAANGVTNETAQRAKAAGKPTGFTDAIPDMLAAIATAKENYGKGTVLGWGSSYSSALILKLAGDDPELVDGTLSFSP